MSDRILGSVFVLIALVMGWSARLYVAPISYEPIGPRAFPILLAVLMGGLGLMLVLRPSMKALDLQHIPIKGMILAVLSMVIYAAVFYSLGFPVATWIMTIILGRAFGGSWLASVAAGFIMGVGFYFLFDRLLDVVLPAGILSFLIK